MRFSLFSPKARYKTIDLHAEQAIIELHRKHPEMGRHRLHEALAAEGVRVDAFELKRFLRAHKIGTPPPTGQEPLPFGVNHTPSHPWLRFRR